MPGRLTVFRFHEEGGEQRYAAAAAQFQRLSGVASRAVSQIPELALFLKASVPQVI